MGSLALAAGILLLAAVQACGIFLQKMSDSSLRLHYQSQILAFGRKSRHDEPCERALSLSRDLDSDVLFGSATTTQSDTSRTVLLAYASV